MKLTDLLGLVESGMVRRSFPIDRGPNTLMNSYRRVVEMVPVNWLSQLPGNNLRKNPQQMQELANQLETNGINDPIIITVGKNTRTAKLGEGNHRLAAAKLKGYTYLPARVIVGSEYGSEYNNSAKWNADLIPQPKEYFSSDASPSSVFKSLDGLTLPVEEFPQVDSRNLTEAKHAKPVIVYHGTSSRLTRVILKQGMLSEPKSRTWQDDPDSSQTRPSRASLPGSYWTRNLGTAMSSVMRANQANKKPEEDWRYIPGLIVIAQIVPQSAVADEDSINGPLGWAWTSMMKEVLGVKSDALQSLLAALYYPHGSHKDLPKKLLETFTRYLHEALKDSDQHPVPDQLITQTFWAEVHRQYAHVEASKGSWDPLSSIREYLGRMPVIGIPEAERELLACKNKLTRYYRKSARDTEDFVHTLRMDKDIGFTGPSRIIALVQYNIMNKGKEPLRLIYGRVPEDFIKQYETRVGDWPGLIS